jgi:predicted ATPase/class 3 adenylate cyclase
MAPDSREQQLRSPQAYTPRHLAQRILNSRHALVGERKLVTVLFADLKGSLELLSDQDPEQARKILDGVLEHMMEAVHRYEGTVNQIMGDGIMAIFGAPLAHEDHAVRACYAALRMQEAVKQHAEIVSRTQGASIQIRVGLNSGEVVVRAISSDLQMDYTAVGQTTHLAARMEQLALPGSILTTTATLRLAEGYIETIRLGPVNVKGLATAVEIYEVVGALTARSRLQAVAARGLTRFVGRDREVRELERAFERADAGRGQVVALVGEPGVGKSRLVLEFTHSPLTNGWVILESGSVSYERATPYLPIIQLLRAYFRIQDRDDHAVIREKVMDRLVLHGSSIESTLPPILAILDVPFEDPAWGMLEPQQRRRRTQEVVKRLLLNEGETQPLLMVVEDLHWVDSETAAMLSGLVEALPGTRALLLVTYRPEYEHAWANRAAYTQLRIDPLPRASAAVILDQLLGNDPTLIPLKELLIDRTDGNPFFLEESVRSQVEAQVLDGGPGAYRLVRSVGAVRVPMTVEAVLAARIDRLPAHEKRLLQSAAAIGREVPLDLLQAIAEEGEEELRLGLAHLQAAEFLYEAQLFPGSAYAFRHALTHEVAYRALLLEQRRLLHAQIAEAIERLHPMLAAEQADRLAHHAFLGELWDKAVKFLRQAGARASARSASREAIGYFERALKALKHVAETPETLEMALDLRFDLQSACVPLGDLDRMLVYLREAEQLAEAIGDQRRLGRVFASMTHYFWWAGDPEQAVETGLRALEIASSLGEPELEMVANVRLGQAYFALGEYSRVVAACRTCLDNLRGDLVRQAFGHPALPAVVSLAFMGRSLALLGDFRTGVATTQEAIDVAEHAQHPYSIVLAYWASGDTYLSQGNVSRGMAVLEHARALCDGQNFALMAPIVDRSLGEAYALSGRHEAGLALLRSAVDELAAMRFMPALPSAYCALGEGLFLAGRLTEGFRSAERAQELCRIHHQRGNEAVALRVLGEIYAGADPPDVMRAEAAFRGAIALAEAGGNRALVARCGLGLGKLWRKTAERERAKAFLDTALGSLRALEMQLWLDEAERELVCLQTAD